MALEIRELKRYIESKYGDPKRIFLDLYVRRVRVMAYTDEFDRYFETQIPYIIGSDTDDSFDATIVLWKETDPAAPDVISEYDELTDTYYYGVKNTDFEEFIRQGHFLVQIFYRILKTPHSSLAHGAVVGINGCGALLCARGQRGKSTLSVLSMLKGMEYVADDYFLLEEDESHDLFASPIYSIITLSPEMADRMSDKLAGTVNLGKNARKDKDVYNISVLHGSFRKHYPVRVLMFPEITGSATPFIREASAGEKGRAITQLIHSTMSQMNDTLDSMTTKKLLSMLAGYECLYFGLSPDIDANAEFIKEFMKGYDR